MRGSHDDFARIAFEAWPEWADADEAGIGGPNGHGLCLALT
jgi:hypothetical protein